MCDVQVLRPTESKVVSLGLRDILPPGRHTYELQLHYAISIPKVPTTPQGGCATALAYRDQYRYQWNCGADA